MDLTDDYIAGFFDGEGCIYWQPKNGGRSHDLRVTISQNDRRPLDLVAARYGGTVRALAPGKHRWTVYTAQAEAFLRAMDGRLVVKAEQATAALERRAGTCQRAAVSS